VSSRAGMRRQMFLAQDGVTLCMTLRALNEVGVLEPSLEGERSLAELMPGLTEAGFGALRVAVHGLVATGWATELPTPDPATTYLRWSEAGREAMATKRRYVEIGDFLAGFERGGREDWTAAWEPKAVERFAALVAEAEKERGRRPEDSDLIEAHLDGALIVPAMLWLHESGLLGEGAPELPQDALGSALRELLSGLGWLDESGAWTETGVQARAFALHFGGVATYLPLLAAIPRLYRGEATVVPDPTSGKPEWHVNRALNVRISAAAHRRYFADSEPLFLEIFNREPVAEQPRFIADMGCGQGSWLVHLHRLVAEKTIRGKHLDEQPLTMIGVDPDPTALAEAEANLARHGVPALLLRGDVTDPDGLAAALAEQGVAIEDGLHIRSFIDHERSYIGDGETGVPGWSTGIYLDAAGAPIPAKDVERDLVAHLQRWARHVSRHGMVVLEVHCNDPEIVARHLGSMHGLAFDAHQAYSKQYPVEHPAFLECCRLAGLQPVGHAELRYPAMRPFVAISLNRLIAAEEERPLPALDAAAPREDTWRPRDGVDLSDGEALHEIIFWRGDMRYPASWCAGPTGFVVRNSLEAVEAKLAAAEAGSSVRVLDYGAGTGTATIELLKGCRERRLDRLAMERGVEIEVHLVDLPSSWYALGYRLLGDCAWICFHSLRAEGGGFRPLAEVLGGRTVDVATANMVFHLIPGKALERTMDGLAGVLSDDGRLFWSAPDLGPASSEAVPLHDPNRLLRERWLELLAGGSSSSSLAVDAACRAQERLDDAALAAAQDRADRRIRPRPLAAEVTAALETRFDGETRFATYEMLGEDILRGLLVPSNQAEFLPEIADREEREAVITELMRREVLPKLREGPAATGLGLNFHWTLGAYRKR
jgi:SAM-dependent methyltransferase